MTSPYAASFVHLRFAAIGALAFAVSVAPVAEAAEVVAVRPLSPEHWALVAAAAGAQGAAARSIEDLRSVAFEPGPADAKAIEALNQTLADVRAYETRLDGELLIMQELEAVIGRVKFVRSDDDRDLLFRALAYQGFAVHRFFETDLPTDERAKPWRTEHEGAVWVSAWADGIALEPKREVTPYDIAQAPQRVAFGEHRAALTRWLPAQLDPGALPAGATVFVDGRAAPLDAAGTIKVQPGRHLIHVERDGRVIQRLDLRVKPIERVMLEAPLGDAEWNAWVAGVVSGAAPTSPPAVAASIARLGGDVWVVGEPAGKVLPAWKLSAAGVEAVEIPLKPVRAPGTTGPTAPTGDSATLSVGVALRTGWTLADAYYLQDPVNAPRTAATVNSAIVEASLSADADVSVLRVGIGLDLGFTPGEWHEAGYGSDFTRLRLHPHVALGVPLLQFTGGWVSPHHPAFGLKGSWPIGPLEVTGRVTGGLPLDFAREGELAWNPGRLRMATVGLGWRSGQASQP